VSDFRNVIEFYDWLIDRMEAECHTEKWKAIRRLNDTSLRLRQAELEYEKMQHQGYADFVQNQERFSEEDLADIKQAVEMRRQVFRKMKELKAVA